MCVCVQLTSASARNWAPSRTSAAQWWARRTGWRLRWSPGSTTGPKWTSGRLASWCALVLLARAAFACRPHALAHTYYALCTALYIYAHYELDRSLISMTCVWNNASTFVYVLQYCLLFSILMCKCILGARNARWRAAVPQRKSAACMLQIFYR